MAKNRLCDVEIWQKDWFLNLSDKQKLLTKFLFDNCDCAGFYQISWRLLKIYFNDEITKEDFAQIKQVKFINDELIFIEDFCNFQYKVENFSKLNPNNNAHLGALKLLKKYGVYDYENLSPSLGASEPLTSPSLAPKEPLPSPCLGAQEKEKEKDKDKEKDKEGDKEKEKEKEKEISFLDETSFLSEEKIQNAEEFIKRLGELYPKVFKENPKEGAKYTFLKAYNPKSVDFNLLLELALKANPMNIYPPNAKTILDVLPRARIEVKEEQPKENPPNIEEDEQTREVIQNMFAKYGRRRKALKSEYNTA